MIYKDQLVPTGELSNVGYSIMTNVEKSYRAGAEIIAGIKPADFLNWDLNLTLSRTGSLILLSIILIIIHLTGHRSTKAGILEKLILLTHHQ